MRRLLLACALIVTLPHEAFAWGNLGHQAIGAAAQSALTPTAQEGLAKVFGQGTTLAAGTLAGVATWPDDVRNRMTHGTVAPGWDAAATQEADQFNRDHKGNSLWHFVNLPLGATGYPDATTPANDPVRHFGGARTSRRPSSSASRFSSPRTHLPTSPRSKPCAGWSISLATSTRRCT